VIRTCIILLEGLRFLWAFRDRKHWWRPLPPKAYLWWRFGTVYGLQPPGPAGLPDGTKAPKTIHVVWSYFPSTEAKSVVIEVDAASFRTMPNEIGIPLPNGGWVLARQVELLDKPPPGQGSA
jgi:hypothetical protein